MDEIKVGEFCRINGEIFKVKKVHQTIGEKIAIIEIENRNPRRIDLEKDKHSFNIIDLIEVGDFVNENEVIDKYLFDGEIPVLETTGDETNAKCMCEGDIKSILTHEQYKRNCYKIN